MAIRPDTTSQVATVQQTVLSVGVLTLSTNLKTVNVHSTDLQGVWVREDSGGVTLYPWNVVKRIDIVLGKFDTIGDMQEHG